MVVALLALTVEHPLGHRIELGDKLRDAFSGTVMMARSSARSEPIGQGSRSGGKFRAISVTRRGGVARIGAHYIEDRLDVDRPGRGAIEVGDHRHRGGIELRLAGELPGMLVMPMTSQPHWR